MVASYALTRGLSTAALAVAISLAGPVSASTPAATPALAKSGPGLWTWLTSPAEVAEVVAHKDIITDISFSGYGCNPANTTHPLSSSLNASLLAELKAAGVRI
jgi:hypothetical protein